jgi:hypothetical protein
MARNGYERLALRRLSVGAAKPQQNCDERFDTVRDHEIGDGGDRRFALEASRANQR